MPVPQRRPARLRHGIFVVLDRVLAWVPSPGVRARLLRALGASIGSNVRIHSVRFFNLEQGLSNLRIDDDVHVGTECLIDLTAPVHLGAGAVLAPRVVVLTHQDAGSHHGAPVAEVLGTHQRPTTIGPGAFVGVGATVLCGADVGHHAVVAAGSVVTEPVEPGILVAGAPSRPRRSLRAELGVLGVAFDDVGPTPATERR